MVQVGQYNRLEISRFLEFGVYLKDGKDDILLPKRWVPENARVGDEVEVFIHHDSEDRLIATTQKPYGVVGDIVPLKVVSVTRMGAFLDWGLMKDLFVPQSKQISTMKVGGTYMVKIYIDAQTGRVAATEKIDQVLEKIHLSVTVNEAVNLLAYRKTPLGYEMIINKLHVGLLHDSDIFQPIKIGDNLPGFVKNIREDGKIDVMLGKRGFEKVEGSAETIMQKLIANNGFLPYHDKSNPQEIYEVFNMSKKAFKMATGGLFKDKKIVFVEGGIKLA